MLEKSACDEDLRTPRHLLALGACDVWGGIQGRNQDSVFPSELEAELMDYVILPPAAVTLIKISAKLTMMDLFALETHRPMGAAPVWPLVSSSKRTKPNRTPATTTHMAAAAVLCCEEQNLPQSAGSHTIGIPPPESGLRDLRLIPKNSLKARRKRTATKVYDRRSNISFSHSCKIKFM